LPRKKPPIKRLRSQYKPVRKGSQARTGATKAQTKSATGRAKAVNFAGLLKPLITEPKKPQAKVNLQNSPLAHLEYQEELNIKNQACAHFWQHYKLPGIPEPIIASPKPRRYRTTSKRKTIVRGSTLYLVFNDWSLQAQNKAFVESPLEPREHGRIFTFLQKKISEPAFKLVADHLNYLIIRGTYQEHGVIFNVDTMNGPLVRKLKIIADHLQKFYKKISAAYIYPSPGNSDYYLEAQQPADILQFKKLFGKPDFMVCHHSSKFLYHPTSFSQVNESIVPTMLEMAKELLAPHTGESLLDLYSGYGLFSHYLAPHYKKIMGIDAEGPSIRAAITNKKLNKASKNARFLAKRITDKSIDEIPFPAGKTIESILLDPPRQGPQDGVIAALGRRDPHKVLHIHCGVDQIPSSIEQWKQCGYHVNRIVPLDMFPGSPNLEVLILLTREKQQKMHEKQRP